MASGSKKLAAFRVVDVLDEKPPRFGEAALTLRLQGKPLPAPLPLAARCPQLPASVARMLEACIAEAPDERPSATEAARALSTAAVVLVQSASLVAG